MINIELKNKNLIDNSNKIKKHIDSTEYPIQTVDCDDIPMKR